MTTLLFKHLSSALSNRMSMFLLETPLLLKKLQNQVPKLGWLSAEH